MTDDDERLSAQDIDLAWHRDDLGLLNRMARVAYALRGYSVPDGFDFSVGRHPHEREAFAVASGLLNFLREEGFEE
jgi:hypothetical protein